MEPSSHKHRQIDFTWPIVLCLILAAGASAIYLNLKHTDNSASKVQSSFDVDNGDLKINWDQYPTRHVNLATSLNITSPGTYHLSGTLSNGNITVATNAQAPVRLILDNVTITSSNGPAIYCSSGDDLVIELVGENTISDSDNYANNYNEDVTGAIYSKADLTFQGEGTLNLTANYQDGIISKDDLKFISGKYNIIAIDDAIRGKDSVYIVNGAFKLDAGADGIKTTNLNDVGKGFVMIEQGDFNIISGAKGIKATNNVVLYNGNYAINTTDDSIHCDNYIGIINGTYNIDSGDDGIHANKEVIIDGGQINIAKTYEGIEAQIVTINNGNIHINATDDGINAGGGADESTTNRHIGEERFNTDSSSILSINGGTIYINSAGDGVDSNGWVYFNGGTTIVDGPTNNGNGALDAGMGIIMNGGEVFALGSAGMAETLGSTSTINSISVYFETIYQANTKISIKNSLGDTIFEHISAKSFSHLSAGSVAFKLGETYSLYINDEHIEDFTISGIVTNVGNTNSNQQMAPGNHNIRK